MNRFTGEHESGACPARHQGFAVRNRSANIGSLANFANMLLSQSTRNDRIADRLSFPLPQ